MDVDSNSNVLTTQLGLDNHLTTAVNGVLELSSLEPCPEVNFAFTRLVRTIINYGEDTIVDPKIAHKVQKIAGTAECHLEKYWATRIINSNFPHLEIKEFPYYENYQKLVQLEINLLLESGVVIPTSASATFRVLMVGSGPLTMTSFVLQEFIQDVHVDNMDICKSALSISSRLNDAICAKNSNGFILGNGSTVRLNPEVTYDLIIIAALAGVTQSEKQDIIDNVLPHLGKNGRVLIRSAVGARELLYPRVQIKALQGVNVLTEFHPTDEVINSVIICSKS